MEDKRKSRNDDIIEIDLLELFMALKKRIWIILAAAIVGFGLAGAFSKFVLVPQYQSKASMYILSKETTLTSLADLQIGSQLTQDYKVLVVSRPVLQEAIEELGIDLTYRQLQKKLTIENPTNTRILSITAQDSDPVMAKKIADTVAQTASSYIGDIMEMIPPKLFEEGEVPTEKFSPSNAKNAVIGALIGIVLVCGLTTVEVLMNDTVTTEEDVAKYLGIPVLASVPEREGKEDDLVNVASKSRKKKRRSKRK